MTSTRALVLGGGLGLTLSAALFFTLPWYHDLMVWEYTHFWGLVPLGLLGAFVGWLTD